MDDRHVGLHTVPVKVKRQTCYRCQKMRIPQFMSQRNNKITNDAWCCEGEDLMAQLNFFKAW